LLLHFALGRTLIIAQRCSLEIFLDPVEDRLAPLNFKWCAAAEFQGPPFQFETGTERRGNDQLAMSDRALYESSNGDSSVWASAEP